MNGWTREYVETTEGSMEGDRVEEDTEQDRRGATRPLLVRRQYLFVILEADRLLSGGARFALEEVDRIAIRRGPERRAVRAASEHSRSSKPLTIELPGRAVSSSHAALERSHDGWTLVDLGSKNGCYVNGQRVAHATIGETDVIEIGRTFLMLRSSEHCMQEDAVDFDSRDVAPERALQTVLPNVDRRLRELKRMARSRVSVILTGESGTGKELLARALHEWSGRAGDFVPVNCAALTESLAQAQLFGHLRGAFSGAVGDAPGFVRSAHGGTLLLDEVQELSRSAQAALLRVAQEREVTPIGAARAQSVDVRFVATCPEPLHHAIDKGNFRPDLFARLSGCSHPLTPLRDRVEDIGIVIASVLRTAGVTERDRLRMAPDFALRLLRHTWPLNIRELEQILLRALTLATDGLLDGDEPRLPQLSSALAASLSEADADLHARLVRELKLAHGNVAQVARALQKAPMQVHRWMKRLAIDPRSYRS